MGNETKGLKSLEELETERKTVKNKSRWKPERMSPESSAQTHS